MNLSIKIHQKNYCGSYWFHYFNHWCIYDCAAGLCFYCHTAGFGNTCYGICLGEKMARQSEAENFRTKTEALTTGITSFV